MILNSFCEDFEMSEKLKKQLFVQVLRKMYDGLQAKTHKEKEEGGGAVYDLVDYIVTRMTGEGIITHSLPFSVGSVIAGFLIAVAKADGKLEDVEKQSIKEILAEVMHDEKSEVIDTIFKYSVDDLAFSFNEINKEELAKNKEYESIKEAMFESSCWIAYIDGVYHDAEHKVLEEMRTILGFSNEKADEIKSRVQKHIKE